MLDPSFRGSLVPLTPNVQRRSLIRRIVDRSLVQSTDSFFMEKFFPLFVVRQIELLESDVQRIGRILLSASR